MTSPMPGDRSDGRIEAALRSTRFRRQREADWRRLEAILVEAERGGTAALTYGQARDLAGLYREAANALSVARAISLDRALLDYLEALTARAWLAVYAPQTTPGRVVARFFAGAGPAAVRRSWPALLVAGLALILGVAVGILLYRADPSWFGVLIPPDLAGPRGPGASTEELRGFLYDPVTDASGLSAFASYLFSHNTLVAVFAFGLGAFAAAPTILLLIYNGAIVGAFIGLHVERGLGWDLGGWLSIHGVTELSAIVIASAGGVLMGAAVLFPGPRARGAALRHAGRDAVKLAVVAAVMLIAAAFLEGFGRQLITDRGARYAIGWGAGALWLAWFLFAGRGGAAR
jgi:uncharacterized membrane protein SpoIIM required for sporulation